MAGSMKDALQKSGRAPLDVIAPKPTAKPKAWLEELPEQEDFAPHVPFDAPALTKPKDPPPKK